ncbi:MAG: hypothetical protein WDA03_10420 [Trueperaceae bacterium]
MNKKFVMGCLIAVAAVLVVGGGAAYFYVIRPLTSTVRAGAELTKLVELDNRVTNKRAFTAPSDGLLQQADVERYLQVTSGVMAGLQNRAKELESKYDSLRQGNPGVRQVLNAYADIIRLVVEAKEMQVNALNAAGFSVAEYDWVRRAVLQAAGHGVAQVNLAALAQGEVEESGGSAQSVPEANVELVAPHLDHIGEYVGLAMFGL